MPFISYAQNHEDVLLWRALGHLERGFYIDVGAADPVAYSVTCAFYRAGWRGINLEPVAAHYQRLQAERPRDINLSLLASDREGMAPFLELPDTGLSSLDLEQARQLAAERGIEPHLRQVPCRTLAQICAEQVTGPIHFLKIDVEGAEGAVLAGADFHRWRPWIVLVEALDARTHEPTHARWENLLLDRDYRLAWFDGLNRYYVAAEHAELIPRLAVQPNTLDDYIPHIAIGLREEIDRHQAAERYWRAQAEAVQAHAASLDAECVRHRAEIDRQRAAKDYWEERAAAEHARVVRLEIEFQHYRAAAEQRDFLASRDHAALLTARTALETARDATVLSEARHQALRHEHQHLDAAHQALHHEHQHLDAAHQALHHEHQHLDAAHQALQLRLEALLGSGSWRLTAPLRTVLDWLTHARRAFAGSSAPPRPPLPVAITSEPIPAPAPEPVRESVSAPAPELAAASGPYWRLVGHLEGHYSLAVINRGLALALAAAHPGQVAFRPWHGQPYPPDAEPSDLPAAQAEALRALVRRAADPGGHGVEPDAPAAPVISLVHHYPPIADPDPAALRLALFFWEETQVPAELVARFDRSCDALLVASRFVRDALRNSGCALPIAVVPPGIDHLIGPDQPARSTVDLNPGQRLRILHVSSAFPRKGVDVLLRAYFQVFSVGDAVELYIKTFPNPHNQVRQQLAELSAARPDAPRVIVDETMLDDAALVALYRGAQLVVLPSRGEGFNLPAAEAMALGVPVIVTGHGGHRDFCTPDTAELLPYTLEPSRSHLATPDACWAEPDAEALAGLLWRYFIAVRDRGPLLEVITARLRNAARLVRDRHTWAGAAAVLDTFATRRLAAAQHGEAPPLRLAVLSPWATRCGIAEYAQGLLGHCNPPAAPARFVLRVYCDSRTPADPRQTVYEPVWRIGDEASVLAALDRIALETPHVLLVEHQPSLFDLRHFIPLHLNHLRVCHQIVLVLELHSTRPLLGAHRPSADALLVLREFDRIIVHNHEDLANLRTLGLDDNVALWPLGVASLEPGDPATERAALGIPPEALVLGSFGFLLPHKGVDTLIRAIAPLQQASGRPVYLIAQNALLDDRSAALLADYRALAEAEGVADVVRWRTDFEPLADGLRRLAAADYLVLAYRHTFESASAAVTSAVATLRPILVSPRPVFADLAECTYAMTGDAVADILAAVARLEAEPDQVAALGERQRRWLAARAWSALSPRFAGLLAGLAADRGLPPAAGDLPRLLVDVSVIHSRDRNTGIQRAVRGLVGELLATPPPGWRVAPVYADQAALYHHSRRYFENGVPPADAPADGQLLQVRPGDVFLGLDLTAHLFPRHETQLAWWRGQGVRIHYVIYDLIPLRHPEWIVPGIPEAFAVWIAAIGRQAHGLHCISAAVAADVRAWYREHPPGPGPLPRIDHFPLGADLDATRPTAGLPGDHAIFLQRLAAAPVCLMVGTVEPRKGHDQVLEAFERLWAEGDPTQLLIVGKPGWHTEALQQRLRDHPEAGRRLHWVQDASDEYLTHLYARARCLLAASRAEGYGLPLVEAARYGLPVIARDIPVFREVAGEHAYYFAGDQSESLAEALARWAALQERGEHPRAEGIEWRTWRDSARALSVQMGILTL